MSGIPRLNGAVCVLVQATGTGDHWTIPFHEATP